MHGYSVTAGLLALSLPSQALAVQAAAEPVAASATVKQDPQAPVDPDDSPEDIAKDAARDLKDSRFYNKPGATRAQYDADWQRCRLIARGSLTPGGNTPVYYYNPSISPLAAGIGGAIGSAIAAAIAEGIQRRANRRACLLINGWRLVELPEAAAARVAKMSDAERSAYFDTIVGAQTVEGKITERTSFEVKRDPSLNLDGPVSGPAALFFGKKVDPAQPFAFEPKEAVIVMTFRRPGEASAGRAAAIEFARYDTAARDLAYPAKDWKKQGDQTTYRFSAASRMRKSPLEVQAIRVTPGDYVLNSTLFSVSNCFGAPAFRVEPGQVLYVGDFTPYVGKSNLFAKSFGVAWSSHQEETRQALAAQQPQLAKAMTAAEWRNGATYACAAVTMDRWDLPGAALADSKPEPAMAPKPDEATVEPVPASADERPAPVVAEPAAS